MLSNMDIMYERYFIFGLRKKVVVNTFDNVTESKYKG